MVSQTLGIKASCLPRRSPFIVRSDVSGLSLASIGLRDPRPRLVCALTSGGFREVSDGFTAEPQAIVAVREKGVYFS